MAQISEYSEAGITVRGIYILPGKAPPKPLPGEEEERKLYLAIEATTEMAIKKAKTEITRLIRDELVRLVSEINISEMNYYEGDAVLSQFCGSNIKNLKL